MDATADPEIQRSGGGQIAHGEQPGDADPRAAPGPLFIDRLAVRLNRLRIAVVGKLVIGFGAGRADQFALRLKHVEIGLTAITAGDDLERIAAAMLAGRCPNSG
jgi:hypothetical protein